MLGSLEPLNSETVNDMQSHKVHHTLEIQDDLLPANDQVNIQQNSSRPERLAELIKQQKWNHLTRELKGELRRPESEGRTDQNKKWEKNAVKVLQL